MLHKYAVFAVRGLRHNYVTVSSAHLEEHAPEGGADHQAEPRGRLQHPEDGGDVLREHLRGDDEAGGGAGGAADRGRSAHHEAVDDEERVVVVAADVVEETAEHANAGVLSQRFLKSLNVPLESPIWLLLSK